MTNNTNQNSEGSSASNSSELPWLAFCYVANELDAQTRREFEIRLEHDQTAREAVVHAFDRARMLDQALTGSETGVEAAACGLPRPELQRPGRSASTKSKSWWPTALVGLSIAGLLSVVLLQLYNPMKLASNTGLTASTDRTNVSVALAETWADSEWESESTAEIADIDNNLTLVDQSDGEPRLVHDDAQDDWMTATLIEMSEEPDSLPLN